MKIEPDLNGVGRSFELRSVESLNNSTLLCRSINKIFLMVEIEML